MVSVRAGLFLTSVWTSGSLLKRSASIVRRIPPVGPIRYLTGGHAINTPISQANASLNAFNITTSTVGEIGSLNFRFSFHRDGKPISPWHDIPLKSGKYFNMITEIPKFEKRKMEICTKERFNPIAQDIKKGCPREYHGPIFWNYGCLPQTWEDPRLKHQALGAYGDNDPLDVVEIGSKPLAVGSITQVKVLGAFAMIDDGELDWKVIVLSRDDKMAEALNDVRDLERKFPEIISGVREWFRWYKSPDGKPLNAFGFEERCLDRKAAEDIIMETHHLWANLKSGVSDKADLWVM